MILKFLAFVALAALQVEALQSVDFSGSHELRLTGTSSDSEIGEDSRGDGEVRAQAQEPAFVGTDDDPIMDVGHEFLTISTELYSTEERLKGEPNVIQTRLAETHKKLSKALEKVLAWANGQFRYPENGVRFSVICGSREAVPGTGGRVEFEVGAVTGDQVPVCVRTCDGEVLVGMTITRCGEIVRFNFGELEYQISLLHTASIPTWNGSKQHVVQFLVKQAPKRVDSRPKYAFEPLLGSAPELDPQPRPSKIETANLVGLTRVDAEDSALMTPFLAQALAYVLQFGDHLVLRIDKLGQQLGSNPDLEYTHELMEIQSRIARIGIAVKWLCWNQWGSGVDSCQPADMTLLRVKAVQFKPKNLLDTERPFDCLEVIRCGRRYLSLSTSGMRFPARLDNQFKSGSIVNISVPLASIWLSAPFEFKAGVEYLIGVSPPMPMRHVFPIDGRAKQRSVVFAFQLD